MQKDLDSAADGRESVCVRIGRHLDRLARVGFFGDVTIKFQGGRVVHVEERRILRTEELLAP